MIISFTALHYGKDYLRYALRSVADSVDACYVAYSPIGSHGHRTAAICPDGYGDLYAEAKAGAGDKLRWYEDVWATEGAQRDSIYTQAPDAEIVLITDADEIWQPVLPELAIRAAYKGDVRQWLVPFRHYWRSFRRCVMHDPAFPTRAVNARIADGTRTLHTHNMAINHMGYAIKPELMEYKWKIHGHLDQMRRDVDYMADVYRANRQTDCHPVGSAFWNPETIDPLRYMPEWMIDHPFFNMDVIE